MGHIPSAKYGIKRSRWVRSGHRAASAPWLCAGGRGHRPCGAGGSLHRGYAATARHDGRALHDPARRLVRL